MLKNKEENGSLISLKSTSDISRNLHTIGNNLNDYSIESQTQIVDETFFEESKDIYEDQNLNHNFLDTLKNEE